MKQEATIAIKSVSDDVAGVFWANGRLKMSVAIALLACSAMFYPSANAACNARVSPPSAKILLAAPSVHAPGMAQQLTSKGDDDANDDDASASLVGFWHVLFISKDFPDEGFDQFHSDGTEILNDTAPPQPANGAGTICLGVFKKIGPRTYKLRHPFWSFDATGTLVGTGVILEQIVVDKGGKTYSGSFSVTTYDLSGNPNFQATGELKAERITAD